MKAISALFLTVIGFNLFAAPTMTIENVVKPVIIKANSKNILSYTPTVYDVGTNKAGGYRVAFVIGTKFKTCVLSYVSDSGAFGFKDKIEGDHELCQEFKNSLEHSKRTSGCDVVFKIDTSAKEFTDIKSTCDFRADLQSEVAPV